MSQINVDFFCFQCWVFLLWVPFPSIPALSAYAFQSNEISCHSYHGLSPVTVSRRCGSLYPLDAFPALKSHSSVGQPLPWSTVNPRSWRWVWIFQTEPKSSMCFPVLESSPSSKRQVKVGSSPGGNFEFAVSLWLSQAACSPTAPLSLLLGLIFQGKGNFHQSFHLLSGQQVSGRACPPCGSAGTPGWPHAFVADAEADAECTAPGLNLPLALPSSLQSLAFWAKSPQSLP